MSERVFARRDSPSVKLSEFGIVCVQPLALAYKVTNRQIS